MASIVGMPLAFKDQMKAVVVVEITRLLAESDQPVPHRLTKASALPKATAPVRPMRRFVTAYCQAISS